MQILVTGGAAFVGSALVRQLVRQGHSVRVLDDLSAGDPDRLPDDVSFQRGDVNDVPRLWTLLQGVDCVYHLAARVSVQESLRYPRDYNAVNVGGTVSVLEAMRDVGVRRLVFVSSGAIYGQQNAQPVTEWMTPNPENSSIETEIKTTISAVPRSGCLRISSTGASNNNAGGQSSINRKPSGCAVRPKNRASISIIANLITSLGCKLKKPRWIQRVAPIEVLPINKTLISKTTLMR